MGRQLELEENLRLGEPETFENAANNVSYLSEKKKRKKNKKDRKREEKGEQMKGADKNGHHLIEERQALDKSDKKGAKKKRKHTETELCSGMVSESNGKNSENGEMRENKTHKKGKTESESNFHADKVVKEGVEDTDEIEGAKGVVVSGNGVKDPKYRALSAFADSGLPDEVLHCCKTFSNPSPIQAHAWPFLLDGRDFIGIAATGSGTVMPFLLVNYGVKWINDRVSGS